MAHGSSYRGHARWEAKACRKQRKGRVVSYGVWQGWVVPKSDPPALPLKPSVLLVEEANAVAEIVSEVLRDEGYAVERAASPGETLTLLSRRNADAFSLVLSAPLADPHKAPYAWLDRLRASTRAPIAIVAGYPASRYADHRQRGYDAYLEAPFDLDDLIALVRRLEAKARA